MSNPDPTEDIRRDIVAALNSDEHTRQQLEAEHGQVWDTKQLQEDFTVKSFLAPFVMVVRKSDGKEGLLLFTHRPRFYFGWAEAMR